MLLYLVLALLTKTAQYTQGCNVLFLIVARNRKLFTNVASIMLPSVWRAFIQ